MDSKAKVMWTYLDSCKITLTFTKRGGKESKQLQNETHVHESEREDSRNSCKNYTCVQDAGGRESKQHQNYTHVHEARRKRVETAAKLHLRSRSEGEECRNSCKITLTFTKRGEKSKQLQNYTYVHEARRKRVETAAKLHLRSQREREESQPWETSYVISLEINWPYLSSHTFQPVKFNLLN